MPDDLRGLGVGAIVALLILKEVFAFLKGRGQNGAWKRQIADLWDWHNRTDSEGVKIWYVRQGLENAIVKLADNIERQTEILQKLCLDMRDIKREVKICPNAAHK